jgi:hypothetical protein
MKDIYKMEVFVDIERRIIVDSVTYSITENNDIEICGDGVYQLLMIDPDKKITYVLISTSNFNVDIYYVRLALEKLGYIYISTISSPIAI